MSLNYDLLTLRNPSNFFNRINRIAKDHKYLDTTFVHECSEDIRGVERA